MTIEYLKCNFQVKIFFPKVPSSGGQSQNIDILKCSKVPLVGTLNLSLKMPDSMEYVSAQFDLCRARKSPKPLFRLCDKK